MILGYFVGAIVLLDALAPCDVLERIIDARARLTDGSVLVQQVYTSDSGATTASVERFAFQQSRFRHDILSHEAHDAIYQRMFREPPSNAEPAALRVWEPAAVRERLRIGRNAYQNRAAPDASLIPVVNGRQLGFPAGPGNPNDIARGLHGAAVTAYSSTGSLHTLTLTSGADSLRITADEVRGWQVVAYHLTRVHADGDVYENHATVIPQQYGDYWYPAYVLREQYANGRLDFSREYTVLEADLGVAVPDREFTWEGLGVRPGEAISSYVPTESRIHRAP